MSKESKSTRVPIDALLNAPGCPLCDFNPCQTERCRFYLPTIESREPECLFVASYANSIISQALGLWSRIQTAATADERIRNLTRPTADVILEDAILALEKLKAVKRVGSTSRTLIGKIDTALAATENVIALLRSSNESAEQK